MLILGWLANVIDSISLAFSKIANLLCLLLVFLTAEQVVARYLFSASSVAMQELEWHLFGLVFLLAAPYALQKDAHVRIDIFYGHLSQRWQAYINLLGILLLLVPLSILLVYYGFEFTLLALDSTNLRPLDYYSQQWFQPGSYLYAVSSFVELLMRKFVLLGEISPDPGGLEARWIIKAAIPLGFSLMLLQGISLLIRNIQFLRSSSQGNTSCG